MYTVASPYPDPDPDPNPWGGGQLSNSNECNSTLTSGVFTPTLIYVDERGHRLKSGQGCRIQSGKIGK